MPELLTILILNLKELGPVVQSIVTLTTLLMVKTILVITISNSWVFLLKKCEQLLQMQKATHIFFSKNNSVYAIFNYQSFNDTLTNDIVSFEQLGPVLYYLLMCLKTAMNGN